jgi:hypothetical protein
VRGRLVVALRGVVEQVEQLDLLAGDQRRVRRTRPTRVPW